MILGFSHLAQAAVIVECAVIEGSGVIVSEATGSSAGRQKDFAVDIRVAATVGEAVLRGDEPNRMAIQQEIDAPILGFALD